MSGRDWMAQGSALFLGAVDQMTDEQLDRPSLLAGWTGRHLVAHVHFNALALGRLVSWAATGTETRMYASPEQRAEEIEQGALRPAPELRELVRASADALTRDFDALSDDARQARVVTAQGRTVPATEIAWLRTREVFVHAVDLDSGVGFGQFPADVTTALLTDVVTKRSRAGEGAELAAWLTGRTSRAPRLGAWL